MTELHQFKCVPCRGGIPPLTAEEIASLQPQVPEWRVVQESEIPRLTRVFKTKGFAGAIRLADRIAAIADEQDHHPALLVEFGRLTVSWWTHAIRGLHKNDFIMAARTDRLAETEG